MRIMVTNDDGINSTGLHKLARAIRPLGEVVIVAPDREYSGAGAAVGTPIDEKPEAHKVDIEGIDEAWAVNGPPALLAMFAVAGVFNGPFDLVVSGINPGANVGNSVYHSGTIGAATTARNRGITGIAISQAIDLDGVDAWGHDKEAWDAILANQKWDSAAAISAAVVAAVIASPPTEPSVLNINIPSAELSDIKGWRYTSVGQGAGRDITTAKLEADHNNPETHLIKLAWGPPRDLDPMSDGGAVMDGYVSLSWISQMDASQSTDPIKGIGASIEAIIG